MCEHESSGWRHVVEARDAEIADLRRRIEELHKERDGLRIDIAGLIDESRTMEHLASETNKCIVELRFEVDDLKRTIIKLNREKRTAEERIEDKSSQGLREYEFRIQNQLGQITAYEFILGRMFNNG